MWKSERSVLFLRSLATRADCRQMLIHSQQGSKFLVEVKAAITSGEAREEAESQLEPVLKRLSRYDQSDYNCHVRFDMFGELRSIYHDKRCLKDIPVDIDVACDIELLLHYRWQRDKSGRQYDFMSCFRDTSRADSVFPLTTGRVMDSCIHDHQ